MRSMFSASAESDSPRRAFTLVELLAVAALMTMLAAALAIGLSRASPDHQRGAALRKLATVLALHRMEAMRSLEARRCRVDLEDGTRLAIRAPEDVRVWRIPPTSLVRSDRSVTSIEIRFAPDGRTSERRWRFDSQSPSERDWALRFDPLSGVPRAAPRSPENTS